MKLWEFQAVKLVFQQDQFETIDRVPVLIYTKSNLLLSGLYSLVVEKS